MKTDAQKKATAKWDAANLDRIEVKLKKGTKEEWKKYCDELGLSMAQFVDRAVKEFVEKNMVS